MGEKNRNDRRVTRTRRSLSGALVELIQEKHFDEITVQNVLDRADVGRSTFYTHFRDKEDLFQQNWQHFLDMLVSQIYWEQVGQGSFIPVYFLFDHLKNVQPFYRGLVRSRKTDAIFKSGLTLLSERINTSLKEWLRGKPAPSVPLPILSHYVSSEIFSLLKWWLDHKMPHSPERMDQIFHQLVTPGLQSALRGSDRPIK